MNCSLESLNSMIRNIHGTFREEMFYLYVIVPQKPEDASPPQHDGPFRIRRVECAPKESVFSITIHMVRLKNGEVKTIGKLANEDRWLEKRYDPFTMKLTYSERDEPFEVRHQLNLECIRELEEGSPAP